MKKLMFFCLCMISVMADAARVVDGINYEFDRDKKVAYVLKADASAPYAGDIVIPAKVKVGSNEFTVVAIQESAFIDNDKITSLSLPESIVEIQDFAFRGCKKLTSLYLPDGLTKIGRSAFSYCRGVEELRLPDNSEHQLGAEAFSHMDNLRTLTIPDSWTSLGVPGKAAGYFEESGFSELRIGKNLKYIGLEVFYRCFNLKKVIFSEDCALEEIGKLAFASCRSLLDTKFLPKSLKIIGESAFKDCTNLKEATIPSNVEVVKGGWYGLYTGKLIIQDGTTPFTVESGADSFSPVNIYLGRPIAPSSKSNLFSTSKLKRIDFGPYFKGGAEFKFGSNVRLIYSCVTDPSVMTCKFDDDVYDNAILYVPVGTMDAYMAHESFSKFFDVREFYPEGYLGNSSWYIDFADILAKNICLDNWDANYDCEISPHEIESVTDIGKIFKESRMTSFDEFKYFKGLKTIPEEAFYSCKYLESIELPYTITEIKDLAFAQNSKLKSLTISYNVSTIGESAFSNCHDLESVVIPASVKNIGENAFSNCRALAKVTCLAKEVPQADKNSFGYNVNKIELSVRKDMTEAFKSLEPWKNFKNFSVAIIKGDANCDYEFDNADIKCAANYLLDKEDKDFEFDAADYNGDGVVNVADIVEIIKMVQYYNNLRK
jgi:hypothetical protein